MACIIFPEMSILSLGKTNKSSLKTLSASKEDMNCTPPNVREKLGKRLIPEYEDWCTEEKVRNIVSETAVFAYFSDMRKNKEPSTL